MFDMNISHQDIRFYKYFCHLIYPFKQIFGQLFCLMTEALVLYFLKMYFFVPSVIYKKWEWGGGGEMLGGTIITAFQFWV